MNYRPDIDGLRAVAVLPVVLFHAGVTALGGGFVGVDVFFVISGYLITSLIAEEIRGDRFSIARFYERRIRRIMPALIAVLAVCVAAALWLLPPFDLVDFGRSALATAGFGSNVLFWRQSGYFDAPAHLKPLLHTWSLAVEEQFYIFFPLLLFALRRRRKQVQLVVVGALFAASLVACIWMTAHDASTAFYLAPFRTWELLTGSLLALVEVRSSTRAWPREALAVGGLTMIVWSVAAFTELTPFPGVHALVPCIGAGLIIHAGRSGSTFVGRILASPPLVFVGKISYSLYLWHWPFLIYAGFWFVHPMTAAQTAVVVTVAGGTSVLSWRFVEQPFRRTKLSRRKIVLAAVGAMGLVVAFGVSTQLTHGWPARISSEARRFDAARTDRSPDRERCHATDAHPIPFADKCTYGPPRAPVLAIWGDSFAAELGYELGQLARAHGDALLYISYSACGPAVDAFATTEPACERHNEEVLDRLAKLPSLQTVVLVARYEAYEHRGQDGFLAGFTRVAEHLADAGKQVVVVYPIPSPPGHVPSILARLVELGRSPGEAAIVRADYDAANRRTTTTLDTLVQHPGIRGAHPERALCDADRCKVLVDGQVLYFDADHLSLAGARLVLPQLGLYPGP